MGAPLRKSHRLLHRAPSAGLPAELRAHLSPARELLDSPSGQEELFASGLPALDRLLAGGLPRGMLVELRGRQGSGRFSLVLALLAAATARGEAAALIDLGGQLDPERATACGADLSRLLWVHPHTTREALAAAEIALAGALPLVVLELGLPPIPGGRGAEAAWLRLARAARGHRGALLVSAPYRASGTAAAEVLAARPLQGEWHGAGPAPRLLRGLALAVEREKSRRHPQPETVELVLRAAGWEAMAADPATAERRRRPLSLAGRVTTPFPRPSPPSAGKRREPPAHFSRLLASPLSSARGPAGAARP
ncbi:MAG TPA: hypothetical protein VMT16_12005 [Thermoanaerobaculia bacterium]|nr:hypothetical protein [Thermoanaerobaculia bacterium]